MSAYEFETAVGICVTKLTITQFPRDAVLKFSSGEETYDLRFDNPRPLMAITSALEDCDQVRISDRNANGMQLEFGRYNVELWDEDNPYAEFTVDAFELSRISTT